MFVWGLKLEKILKIDGAPEMYLVSSVRRAVRVIPGTCSHKKKTTREEETDEDAPFEEMLGLFTWRCREISPLQNARRSSETPTTSPAAFLSTNPPSPPHKQKAAL